VRATSTLCSIYSVWTEFCFSVCLCCVGHREKLCANNKRSVHCDFEHFAVCFYWVIYWVTWEQHVVIIISSLCYVSSQYLLCFTLYCNYIWKQYGYPFVSLMKPGGFDLWALTSQNCTDNVDAENRSARFLITAIFCYLLQVLIIQTDSDMCNVFSYWSHVRQLSLLEVKVHLQSTLVYSYRMARTMILKCNLKYVILWTSYYEVCCRLYYGIALFLTEHKWKRCPMMLPRQCRALIRCCIYVLFRDVKFNYVFLNASFVKTQILSTLLGKIK